VNFPVNLFASTGLSRVLIVGVVAALSCTAQAQNITVVAPNATLTAPGVAAGSTVSYTVSGVGASGGGVVVSLAAAFSGLATNTAGWTCSGLSCSGPSNGFTFSLLMPGETAFPNPNTQPTLSGVVTVSPAVSGTSGTTTTFYSVLTDTVIVPGSVGNVAVGQAASLALTVSNGGPGGPYNRFRGMRVLLTMPADLRFDSSAAPWGCTAIAQNVTCTLPDAPATAAPVSNTLSVNFTRTQIPAGGGSQISYSVAAPNNDPNPGNNQGGVLVGYVAPPDESDLRLLSSPQIATSPGLIYTTFRLDAIRGPALGVQLRFSQPSAIKQSFTAITASPAPGLNCAIDSGNLSATCTAASLSQTDTREITLVGTAPVVALGASAQLSILGAATSTSTELVPSDNQSTAQITLNGPQRASLQATKTVSAATVIAGQEFSYTIGVNNIGAVSATSVALRDPIDPALTLISATVLSGDVTCPVVGSAEVACSLRSLAAGASAQVEVRVRAPAVPGTISNTVFVSANNTGTERQAQVNVQIVAPNGIDLALDKSDSADPVAAGSEFEYVLSLSNRSTIEATEVVIDDALPASVSFISASGGGFSCTGSTTLRCTRAVLAGNETAAVRVRVRANAAGAVLNTASASAKQADANPANNSDSETTTVTATSTDTDISLSAPAAQSANVGSDTVVTYTVRNLGPANASCGAVNLSLSGGVAAAFSLKTVTGASCTVTGSTATCPLPRLAAGEQLELRATLGTIGAASATLSGSVSCATDTNATNNATSTVLTGQVAPGTDLSVRVEETGDVLLATEFDYRIAIANGGPGAVGATQLTAILADGLAFVSATGANCTPAPLSLSCQVLGIPVLSRPTPVVLRVRASTQIGTVTSQFDVSSTTPDPNLTNNSARVSSKIVASDVVQVTGIITQQLNDRFARDAAPVVADICARPSAELVEQCNAIINAALDRDIGALQNGLRAIFPEEVLAERLALVQQADTQFSNIDSRLNELRAGGGGLSLRGLNLQFGQTNLPLGLLQSAMDADDEPAVGGSGDLISPWGFFINGSYSRGDQKLGQDLRNVSSDFKNIGLTGGVDYRLSARTVLGLALGYSKFNSDVSDDGDSSNRALTLTGYGSHYFSDQFYADARVTVGNASFDSTRRIRFAYQSFSIDKTALGSTDARQYAFAAGVGYHVQKGGYTITPNANIRYFRSTVDGYTETGAGANNVIFGDQSIDSLQYNLGVQISHPISISNGVLAPQFDLSYGYETQNADFSLNARLASVAATQSFTVRAQDPDKSFGNVGLGLVYVTSNGKQAYINYRKLFSNSDISRDTINLGARFEF
jgi:outer membrane autotransporter protein/uncharacterized repeat protein (TIGR01451 family)